MENGKSAVVPEIESGIGFGSTEFHVLRPKHGVNPRYIWHFVRQKTFRQAAKERMTGSVGQARVPISYITNTQLALPNVEAQLHVVETLDKILASSRNAADHIHSAARTIERIEQAIIDQGCTGILTTLWRNKNPEAKVVECPTLSSQAAKHSSTAPNSSELATLPSTWSWWSIEQAMSQVIDYRGRTPPHQSSGPIPQLRTTQVRDGRIDWNVDRFVTEEIYAAYMTRGLPQLGDVLFTMEAPLGEVGVVDRDIRFSIAQRILLLRAGPLLVPEFLALCLRCTPVQQAILNRTTGSGVTGIAYKRLRSVQLPVPPLTEQQEILTKVQALQDRSRVLGVLCKRLDKQLDASVRSAAREAFNAELFVSEGT
jgi:type I restriction enzyme S subunit